MARAFPWVVTTVSKQEMIFAFSECDAVWGDHQFTPCSTFTKGPRFMNMVMTFILHPLSHYDSITEPLLNFCFPFLSISLQIFLHILFFLLQMCIRIRRPVISSSSLQLSCRFYAIFLFILPHPTTSPLCVPLTTLPLNRARHNFDQGGQVQQLIPLLLLHPYMLPPLLRAK